MIRINKAKFWPYGYFNPLGIIKIIKSKCNIISGVKSNLKNISLKKAYIQKAKIVMCKFCNSKGFVISTIFKDKKLMCPNPNCDSRGLYRMSVFDQEEAQALANKEESNLSEEEINLAQALEKYPNIPEVLLKEMLLNKTQAFLDTCIGKFNSSDPYLVSHLMRLHSLYANHIQTNLGLSREFKNVIPFNPTRKIKNDP